MSAPDPWSGQPDVTWSIRVEEVATGNLLVDHEPNVSMPTASVGKILLLLTVADGIARGALSGSQPTSRSTVAPVADSGLWQHLDLDTLTVVDAARLVGAVSDNLATNVLVELVGLDAVAATAASLELRHTGLHDLVRDERTTEHPPALSTGTAGELAQVCADIERGQCLSTAASEMVREWLRLDTDLSMVAASFGLDPLAHVDVDRGLRLWNKTGTNVGVRCDVGVLRGSRPDAVAYAVLAGWTPASADDPLRDEVMTIMREIGCVIRAAVS